MPVGAGVGKLYLVGLAVGAELKAYDSHNTL
jgi:hypothetical protein